MIESLHNHTTTSDGQLTHTEFLEQARDHGFSVIAFTDHDTLPPLDVVQELSKPQWTTEFPTKYIWGIELTASAPADMKVKTSDFHIVGLFVDPTNAELTAYCQEAKQKRLARMQHIVHELARLGFQITEEACLKQSGGESVGRPHIVRALQTLPGNEEVLNRIIAQFEEARTQNPSLQEAYPDFNSRPLWDKAYPLFLTSTAFIPGVYIDRETADVFECSRLIHGAGGIVILAHYFTVSHQIPLTKVEEWLKTGVLDGAETLYNLVKSKVNNAPKKPPTGSGEVVQMTSDAPPAAPSSSAEAPSPAVEAPSAAKEEDDVEDELLIKRLQERDELKEICKRNHRLWFVGGGDIHTLAGMEEYCVSANAEMSSGMATILTSIMGGRIDLKKTSSLPF
jgi:predicted metal-dependent phosphoesterase TrpH